MSTTTGWALLGNSSNRPWESSGAEFLSTKHLCQTQKARAIGNWTDPSRHDQGAENGTEPALVD